MKCSIVVPVWNPGPSLDRCVASLLHQTMDSADYEIIFVNDGSTDGSAPRLDDIAAVHTGQVHVIHSQPSGFPGRPRNLGLAAARGDYVHFVDNDDVLPPYALEALWQAAVETRADVVFGRSASDFRGLDHRIYRRSLAGIRLADHPELAGTLTPHKMFRREFLLAHEIKFPEAAPLEDQPFVVRAYLHASSITLLADRCYYYYLRRTGSGSNAGAAAIDPGPHFGALGDVIDIIDDAFSCDLIDSKLHEYLLARVWRISLLNPLYSAGFIGTATADRLAIFRHIRELVTTRFPDTVAAGAAAVHRVLAEIVARPGNDESVLAAVLEFAAAYRTWVPEVTATVGTSSSRLELTMRGEVTGGHGPLRLERVAAGWALPGATAPGVSAGARLVAGAGADLVADVDVVMQSRENGATFGLDPQLEARIADDGRITFAGTVAVDGQTGVADAGLDRRLDTDRDAGLDTGLWDVRVAMEVAGITRSKPITVAAKTASSPAATGRHSRQTDRVDAEWITATADGRMLQLVAADGRLRLDVDQWAQGGAAAWARATARHWHASSAGVGKGGLEGPQLRLPAPPTSGALLLTPMNGTRGGVRRLAVTRGLGGAVVRLPRVENGAWHVWTQLDDRLAAQPGDTGYVLYRWNGDWRLECAEK